MSGYDGLRAPFPLRRHQREALAALAAARSRGRRRSWVVLPPGAGKTLVGLETIRLEGLPAVVLSPNTAIQGQWVRGWESFGADASAGTDRELRCPVTALTYQSLAVFDRDREVDEVDEVDEEPAGEPVVREIDRLHRNGRDLVQRLQHLGPFTLVLDECHHLVETWGRLLVDVLELVPEARVLGLTATPPGSLTVDQAAVVEELFGEAVHTTSIPAVVKEGHLAPFADLVWLTEPTAAEQQWLAAQHERFAELTSSLLDTSFGSVPFLTWIDRRFAGDLPFARVAARSPELGDAALRMVHAGLLRLPEEAVGATAEQHRRPPTADDWALLVDDWYDGCLAGSADDRDVEVVERLRQALPSVGWQLTRTGVRRGRSPVDRVLARSAAKSRALVEIVDAEHRALGDRLALLVVCDHESATATISASLTGVVPTGAGSARLALAHLLADPATAALSPLMVTGKTVAGAPRTLHDLRERCPDLELSVGEPDADGIAELTGAWSTRDWVPVVTDHFTARRCQVLVGTRALLGEGWDAPSCTGLVDLSTTTTPGSIVQTRGRTLRLDPEHPDKVAINWTVCAVSDAHPRGDNDWQRTVRKHQGYFGVDATGDVVDGVAHIHPAMSPFAPPPCDTFDALNAALLVRAEDRGAIREAWRVGEPYVDQVRHVVWVRPRRDRARAVLPDVLGTRDPSRPAPGRGGSGRPYAGLARRRGCSRPPRRGPRCLGRGGRVAAALARGGRGSRRRGRRSGQTASPAPGPRHRGAGRRPARSRVGRRAPGCRTDLGGR